MKKKDSESQALRMCTDCNYSFPAHEQGDFMICLKDPDFDPFIDDILESGSCESCRELAGLKRFSWEQEACLDFEPVEVVPIDDRLAARIERLAKEGRLDKESLDFAIIESRIERIDFKTVPVGHHEREMKSARSPVERKRAMRTLGALALQGNKEAFSVLFEHLKNLPLPSRIDEVHHRMEVLESLKHTGFNQALADFLIDDLYRVPSNNTTRGWIKAVFDWLGRAPVNKIEKRLRSMLKERRFSHRMKQTIKLLLRQDR